MKFLILLALFLSGCSVCDFYPAGNSHCAMFFTCKKEGKKVSADGAWCEGDEEHKEEEKKPEPEVKPISNPQPVEFDETYYASWPKVEWSVMLANSIEAHGQDMLKNQPKDWKDYCAGDFAKLSNHNKKQFYITLVSGLAKYESSYNPNATYTEAFNDAKGNKVVSVGLLQLSIESGNAYGCGLKTYKDLFDPSTNLMCGVKIMNRWIGQRDLVISSHVSPWKGAARYWSPFRKDAKRDFIKKQTKALPFCKA